MLGGALGECYWGAVGRRIREDGALGEVLGGALRSSGRRFRGNWEEHWGALEGALGGAGGSTRERHWEELWMEHSGGL